MSARKDLVQIIRDNPGAVAIVDNDCWTLWKVHPSKAPEDEDGDDAWETANRLAQDGEVTEIGDGGYGSGNCYGGDILQACAVIAGITVESV